MQFASSHSSLFGGDLLDARWFKAKLASLAFVRPDLTWIYLTISNVLLQQTLFKNTATNFNFSAPVKQMRQESSLRRGRIAAFSAVFVVTFLLFVFQTYSDHDKSQGDTVLSEKKNTISLNTHRKLLNRGPRKEGEKGNEEKVEPNRIWTEKCSKSDIVISQGATEPLPNGIPTYTVEIMNMCVSGCGISAIHLSCGWFSSARLVNPRVFKRLRFDDCLVNDGNPLVNGRTLSFQYANTFRYPLSVSSVTC